MKIHLLSIFILIPFSSLFSKTTEWKLAGAGDWHTSSNWSFGIPESGDSAIINIPLAVVTLGTNTNVEHIYIGPATTLSVNAQLDMYDSSGDALIIEGTLRNTGTIIVYSPLGEGILIKGTLFNNGEIVAVEVSTFPKTGIRLQGGLINNSGEIEVSDCRSGFICTNDGQLINNNSGEIRSTNCDITFRDSNITSTNEGVLISTEYFNVIEDGLLDNKAEGSIIVENRALTVNKNSIFNNYGFVEIEDNTEESGIRLIVSMGGEINLKAGSIFYVVEATDERLEAYEGGAIIIEEGASFNIF